MSVSKSFQNAKEINNKIFDIETSVSVSGNIPSLLYSANSEKGYFVGKATFEK